MARDDEVRLRYIFSVSSATVARSSRPESYSWDQIIGSSPAVSRVKSLLSKVAAIPVSTVLLAGESGTGKDLMAKTIHYNSPRAARPFQHVTCSALPETLLESELFGHERGAFTDAKQQKMGLFEQADGGTVFLDEIGEVKPALQVKLLRFLEEKEFRRLGGTADIRVDVRVISATNRNLASAMREGGFRQDLFYRLSVLPVRIAPLRERRGDVPLLTRHFIDVFNRAFGKNVQSVAPEAMARLESHSWPGNVRELKNLVERAMLLSEGDELTREDFLDFVGETAAEPSMTLPSDGIDLNRIERDLLLQALKRTGGNQTQAGLLLRLSRDQIRYRIEKFGLDRVPGH
jgi:transcriptional regulator with PAS, ATPase and Fis domain